MGRGQRPPNEFVETRMGRPGPLNLPQRIALPWREFRVIRTADISPTSLVRDWNEVLNDIGRHNRHIGFGRSLGAVAITLVGAEEMEKMLTHKYPKATREPERMRRLHERLRGSFKSFMRDEAAASYTGQTQRINNHMLSVKLNVAGFSNELEDSNVGMAEEPDNVTGVSWSPMKGLPYQAADFAVSRLSISPRRYALDLSANTQLYEERSGILRYFRDYEGLDTSKADYTGWEAHATVLDFHDHIRSASGRKESIRSVPLLPYITFDAVHAEC